MNKFQKIQPGGHIGLDFVIFRIFVSVPTE